MAREICSGIQNSLSLTYLHQTPPCLAPQPQTLTYTSHPHTHHRYLPPPNTIVTHIHTASSCHCCFHAENRATETQMDGASPFFYCCLPALETPESRLRNWKYIPVWSVQSVPHLTSSARPPPSFPTARELGFLSEAIHDGTGDGTALSSGSPEPFRAALLKFAAPLIPQAVAQT